MTTHTNDTKIKNDWLNRPPAQRATSQQASDSAYAVADLTDGSNRRYQAAMNLIRPLIGQP